MGKDIIVLNDYSIEEFKSKVQHMRITEPLFIARCNGKSINSYCYSLVDDKGCQLANVSKRLMTYIIKGLRPKELRVMEIYNQKWLKGFCNNKKTLFIAYSEHYSPASFIPTHTYRY